MFLLSISGLDGSGKTTQIRTLQRTLEQCGLRAHYFHAVDFSIANRLLKQKNRSAAFQSQAVTESSWMGIVARKIVLLIDIFRFRWLLNTYRVDDQVMLTDRYFFDQLINILYLEHHDVSEPLGRWKQWLLKMIPRPDVAIYLRIDPATILTRDRAIEQGSRYLEEKYALFEAYRAQFPFTVIAADQPIDTIALQILALVPQRIMGS